MKKSKSPTADARPGLGTQQEGRLPEDATFFETPLLEDELLDDYVQGNLTGSERDRFERHFLTTPERSVKLRFARALHEYITCVTLKEAFKDIWGRSFLKYRHCIGLALSSGILALGLL